MAKYIVNKSHYPIEQRIKSFMLRIIFPPILVLDLLKFIINNLIGTLIGKLILPSQTIKGSSIEDLRQLRGGVNLTHERHTVATHDGAVLDTLEIKHKSQAEATPFYDKYIICFAGNGMTYEDSIAGMHTDANELKSNVIGFNYRNVGLSTGSVKSKDDLVTDGIAQVQRLLDARVSPNNITLKGHSLGAGIATLVAKHFHDLGIRINLFNGRSFSSLTNVAIGHIRQLGSDTPNNETLVGKICGWIAWPLIKALTVLSKWEINASDAFKQIPGEYKEHMVVRTAKRVRARDSYIVDDAVIPYYSSIHASLKDEHHAQKANLKQALKILETTSTNSDQLPDHNNPVTKFTLSSQLAQFKRRKMFTDNPDENGHNVNMSQLRNRDNKTANTFFHEFVKRAYDDHAIQPEEQLTV